jgi:hypothetical protein
MRDIQSIGAQYQVIEKQKIQVDTPFAPASCANTPHFPLDLMQRIQ